MSGYIGRGAWPASGTGGTLKVERLTGKVVAGPYYLAGQPMIGLAAFRALRDQSVPDLNQLAVHYGARALQRLLNLDGGAYLTEDGLLGAATDGVIRGYQADQGLVVDGQVGPATMRKLLVPHIRDHAGGDAEVVYGLLRHEGAFDPGAVGWLDPDDLGLAQINGRSHPEMSVAARFDPAVAIAFNVSLFRAGMRAFGEVRAAVASYNLGLGGTRTWISLGRPDVWTPPWATTSRNTRLYIDSILNAWQKENPS